jgi:hypothetical protein
MGLPTNVWRGCGVYHADFIRLDQSSMGLSDMGIAATRSKFGIHIFIQEISNFSAAKSARLN